MNSRVYKKHKKNKYIKPAITTRKITVHFFSNSRRYSEMAQRLLAQPWDGDPWGSWSCFLENTFALMSDGSKKEIQNISLKDSILSYNFDKKILELSKVTGLIRGKEKKYFVINDKIRVTGKHRFWVNENTWKRVENLTVNDWLFSYNKQKIPVVSIKKIKKSCVVYNLHLDGTNHNYFAEGALVHNWK